MKTANKKPECVVPAIQLKYRPRKRPVNRLKISSSLDSYAVFLAGWDFDEIDLVEEFKILLLDRGNGVIGLIPLSKGGISNASIDPRLVFAPCLVAGASQVILAHNHPSGKLKPSGADLALTRQLADSGSLLHVQVTDHLIITREGYYSFAENDFFKPWRSIPSSHG